MVRRQYVDKQYVLVVESTTDGKRGVDDIDIYGPYGQQAVVDAQDQLREILRTRNDDRRVSIVRLGVIS
jgi:hypothetical protein